MSERERDLPVPEAEYPFGWIDGLRTRMREALDDLDLMGRRGRGLMLGHRGRLGGPLGAWRLDLDVREREDHYEMTLDLPGVDKKDVQVAVYDDRLLIQGERRSETQEERDGMLRAERFFGRFSRQIPLPPDAQSEGVEAEMKDGVLRLTVPRSEQGRGRRVDIH